MIKSYQGRSGQAVNQSWSFCHDSPSSWKQGFFYSGGKAHQGICELDLLGGWVEGYLDVDDKNDAIMVWDLGAVGGSKALWKVTVDSEMISQKVEWKENKIT